jgi:hypothetical protein
MRNNSRAIGLAAAATLSCAATQANAAACQTTNFFSDFFSGGPLANCSIGNVTILGNSWNPIAEAVGVGASGFFPVPPNEPGIQLFFDDVLSVTNGNDLQCL